MPSTHPPTHLLTCVAFLPSVDEEFETVSTQLLKRTQAMLNKYRLLLLEESRVGFSSCWGPFPCCELSLPCSGQEWGLSLAGREVDGLSLTGYILPGPSLPQLAFSCVLYITLPQRVSPSAEMVMIDRMFIQEEKTTLALDKQLAKEKPGEKGGMGRASPHLSCTLMLGFPANHLTCMEYMGKTEAEGSLGLCSA